jgi:hypothetical protein
MILVDVTTPRKHAGFRRRPRRAVQAFLSEADKAVMLQGQIPARCSVA